MDTVNVSVTAVAVRGIFVPVDPEQAKGFKSECIHRWDFRTRTFDGTAALELGRKMNTSKVYDDKGGGDAMAIAITRGRYILESVVQDGKYYAPGVEPVDILREAIAALPSKVIVSAAQQITDGPAITQADLDALKNAPESSTSDT